MTHFCHIVNSHSTDGASSAHVHCEEAALASTVNDCVPRDEVLMSTNCLFLAVADQLMHCTRTTTRYCCTTPDLIPLE